MNFRENGTSLDEEVSVERVGVVGCGLMGSGIAEIVARAGANVMIVEQDAEAMARGRERIEKSLSRAVAAGKVPEDEANRALANMLFSVDYADLWDRQLVIEAVAENEEIKLAVFRKIDAEVKDPDALLATNTSSIPIIKLAMVTKRPEHVIGMHFFNPVPVLKLVELISSLLTSPETSARVRAYATDTLKKRVITSPDRAGFVVNALLIPYLLSAVRMRASDGSVGAD